MNKQDQAYEVGDRPAQEIEITPEMIEAGVKVLMADYFTVLCLPDISGERLATDVYRAMVEASSA